MFKIIADPREEIARNRSLTGDEKVDRAHLIKTALHQLGATKGFITKKPELALRLLGSIEALLEDYNTLYLEAQSETPRE